MANELLLIAVKLLAWYLALAFLRLGGHSMFPSIHRQTTRR